MTLTIKNVKPEFLPEFERFAKSLNATIAQPKSTRTKAKKPAKQECEICKAHDYTLSPKAEQEILRSMAELENERKNGTLKSYKSAKEMHEDMLKR